LSELGEKSITSLSDSTERARLCNLFFDDAVKTVLREHNWRCATKRQQLSRLEAAPAFGFEYQFEIPSDWIRTSELDIDEDGYKWSQEDNKILTDEESVYMKYVYFLNNPAKWDSQLTECVEAFLAYKLSLGIAGKVSYKDAMLKLYDMRLKKAKGIDSFEGTQDELVSTVLIDCRR
jgi:hypothetical protein